MSEEFSAGESDAGSAAGNPENAAAESAAQGLAEGSPEDPGDAGGSVPVSVVRALRREMGRLRDENRLYRAAMAGGQEAGRNGAHPNKTDAGRMFSGSAQDGPGHLRSLSDRLDKVSREIAFMRFSGDHPDFVETINAHLPALVREKPGLLKILAKSPNPLASAFDMVMKSDSYKSAVAKAGAKGPDELVRTVSRIVKNAEKPGAAGPGGRPPFSSAERIRAMSSDEFRELTERVKAQG